MSFHTHVKHAPRPFLGKNTQGVDPKTQDPQNTLPDAQNDISLTRTPVRKKILEIMASEDFTKQIKESVDNDTEPKHLSSFSNFLKYLESQGVSGLKDSDPSSYYQNLFQKHFPGKVPSDLDVEMKQQILKLIEELGYEKGTKMFLKDSRNALWLAARFNILQDDGNSIGNWREQMLAETFGSVTEVSARQIPSIAPDFHPDPPPSEADSVSDAGIPPVQQPRSIEEASREDAKHSSSPHDIYSEEDSEFIEEFFSAVSDIPSAETFETWLNEGFTPERIKTALQTLNRYGPEEGLRRLKEADPEIATPVERLIHPRKETD